MKIGLQTFTGGITLIDFAIVFAVVAVVGLPSAVAGLTALSLGGLLLFVALAVVFFVRVVALLLLRRRAQSMQFC